MRPAKRLHAIEIEKIEVRRKQGQRYHRFIQIHTHLLFYARLVTNDLAGRYATNGNLTLARTEILDGQPGDVSCQTLKVGRTQALNFSLCLRVNGKRHVLNRRFTLGRCDNDFFNDRLREHRTRHSQCGACCYDR